MKNICPAKYTNNTVYCLQLLSQKNSEPKESFCVVECIFADEINIKIQQ